MPVDFLLRSYLPISVLGCSNFCSRNGICSLCSFQAILGGSLFSGGLSKVLNTTQRSGHWFPSCGLIFSTHSLIADSTFISVDVQLAHRHSRVVRAVCDSGCSSVALLLYLLMILGPP